MNKAILLLGGNMGDRGAFIDIATASIEKLGTITSKSTIYESEAWGFDSDQNFLNIALQLNTLCTADKLLEQLQTIENKMGRLRSDSGYTSRNIDIDILFYNSDITDTKSLIIPHPRLHQRMFTLLCLMDIMPNYIHPTLNKSIKTIKQECNDNVKVWKH